MKKILIFILVFAASTAMFSSFFNSCEKEDCLNADGSADELTIEGSLFDQKTMSSNDLSAIAEALNRMDMHFADGRFVTNELSAKQLGISDYLYFQLQVKIAEANGDQTAVKRFRKRAKRAGETIPDPKKDSDSIKDPTKCVPILINLAFVEFKSPNIPSVDEILSWCSENNYYYEGKGVSPKDFGKVVTHYLNAKRVDIYSLPDRYFFQQNNVTNNKYYIMSSSEYGGHVVRIEIITRNKNTGEVNFVGYNPQEGVYTIYNQGGVIEIYEVNGTY